MVRRKLVKQGAATLMISLPSKWLKQNSLDKGDEVEVEEKNENLLVSSREAGQIRKEITINVGVTNKSNLKNILTHLYRKGFEIITLKNIDVESLKEIRKITSNFLLGFEITKREKNICVVENISEPLEKKYELMLKKTFLLIEEIQDLVLEDFTKGVFKNSQEVEEMKNQQDKFILFCRRLLIKENSTNLLGWELLTFLMHIGHSYFYLYKYAEKNKIKANKKILKQLENLKNYFSLFSEAYYKKDIEFINKINNLKEEYQFGKILVLMEKAKPKETIIFSYMREIFRLIQIGTSPILAEILEKPN